MTQASDLLALAERVEGLTGPDREMDAEIALAQPDHFFNAGAKWQGGPDRIGKIVAGDRCVPGNGSPTWLVPAYTASLDAAMTLVPEGWLMIMGDDPDTGVKMAGLFHDGYDDMRSFAAALPLALTAAALRARAALLSKEPEA